MPSCHLAKPAFPYRVCASFEHGRARKVVHFDVVYGNAKGNLEGFAQAARSIILLEPLADPQAEAVLRISRRFRRTISHLWRRAGGQAVTNIQMIDFMPHHLPNSTTPRLGGGWPSSRLDNLRMAWHTGNSFSR